MPGIEYFLNEPVYQDLLMRIAEKAKKINVTVSGSVIAIKDAENNAKLKNLSMTVPNIVRRFGKNLLPFNASPQIINGVTFIPDPATGSISLSGTSTARAVYYVTRNLVLKRGTYILSKNAVELPAGSYLNCNIEGTGVSIVGANTELEFNVSSDLAASGYVRLDIPANCATDGITITPMVRMREFDSTFEQYNAETYTISDLDSADINALLGNNTFWADSGELAFNYDTDLKLYIDNIL